MIQLNTTNDDPQPSNHFLTNIQEINLNKAVQTCLPDATVKQVIDQITTHNIGAVVVTDTSKSIVGIFTERDYLLKIAGLPPTILSNPISQYMSQSIKTARVNASIWDILKHMRIGKFRHIVIVDSNNRLAGIVSIRDILKHIYANRNKIWKTTDLSAHFNHPIDSLHLFEAPLSCPPDTPINKILHTFKIHNIGAIAITDRNDIVEGIFTERDFIHHLHAEQSLDTLSVSQYMTPDPTCVNGSTTIEEAFQLIYNYHFRHLLVVNKINQLRNILSVKDLSYFICQLPVLEPKPA